ncbi:MAG: RHS repeat-associated core domain-containing protein, partial [Saprospiraceae bacterium]
VRGIVSDLNKNEKIDTNELYNMKFFYPFGMEAKGPWERRAGLIAQRFSFTGQEKMTELGLDMIDYDARLYSGALGRFMQVDPMADQYATVNRYVYTLNNPVRFNDPTGMAVEGPGDPPTPSVAGILYESYLQFDAGVFNFMARGLELFGQGKPGMIVRKEVQYDEHGGVYGNRIVEKPENSAWQELKEIAGDGMSLYSLGAFRGTVPSGVMMAKSPGAKNAVVSFIKGDGADAIKVTLNVPEGYRKTSLRSSGQVVYTDGSNYITPDKTSHKGGAWKMFDNERNLNKIGRESRVGTFDANLKRIGD